MTIHWTQTSLRGLTFSGECCVAALIVRVCELRLVSVRLREYTLWPKNREQHIFAYSSTMGSYILISWIRFGIYNRADFTCVPKIYYFEKWVSGNRYLETKEPQHKRKAKRLTFTFEKKHTHTHIFFEFDGFIFDYVDVIVCNRLFSMQLRTAAYSR